MTRAVVESQISSSRMVGHIPLAAQSPHAATAERGESVLTFVGAPSLSVSETRFTRRMSKGTIGRPSKGERKVVVSRPAIPLAERIEELAAEAGYKYVGDFVASILAREAGMPEYAPKPG